MNLSSLLDVVARAPSLRRLVEAATGPALRLSVGVPDAAKAATVAALYRACGRTVLLLVPRPEQAEALVTGAAPA